MTAEVLPNLRFHYAVVLADLRRLRGQYEAAIEALEEYQRMKGRRETAPVGVTCRPAQDSVDPARVR